MTRIVPLAAVVAVLLVVLAVAQAPSLDPPVGAAPQQRRPDPTAAPHPPTPGEIADALQRNAMKKWNKERQAALKKDTDKLLELATQLKQQVDRSNENILSLEVIRKSEEIEKLAHSVRDKMKANSY